LRTKKSRQNVLPGKSEIFHENRKFLSVGIENFCDRIHDPQTSNQIDAAAIVYPPWPHQSLEFPDFNWFKVVFDKKFLLGLKLLIRRLFIGPYNSSKNDSGMSSIDLQTAGTIALRV